VRRSRRQQAPLRAIVKEGVEQVDVGLEHPIDLYRETLECGHKIPQRHDHVGPTNAYRRRCTQCLKIGEVMNKLAGVLNEAEKPLPVGVGALLFRASGDVLAASRKNDPNDLGLPGGKVDPGETEHQALVRELGEETGLRAKRYHRIFGMVDPGGYWFVTFLVTEWEGEPYSREAGKVVWVPPLRLLQPSCQFREYNRDLFVHLGVLPPQ
jgi:mutator protein MutT